MELGELEFKAEDFANLTDYPNDEINLAKDTANKANRLLRERLAKAPEVFCYRNATYGYAVKQFRGEDSTHHARLVCIELLRNDPKAYLAQRNAPLESQRRKG